MKYKFFLEIYKLLLTCARSAIQGISIIAVNTTFTVRSVGKVATWLGAYVRIIRTRTVTIALTS